jgi:hypothetical protein
MVIVLRHAGPAPRAPVPPPAPARTPVLAPAPVACSAPPTVEMAIDSRPQGALVTTTPTAIAAAQPLGQTPFVLRLPRGEAPVTLVVHKPGFAPASLKVMPDHDKDVAVRLERGISRPPLAGGGISRPPLAASARRHELSANLPLRPVSAPPPPDRAARWSPR